MQLVSLILILLSLTRSSFQITTPFFCTNQSFDDLYSYTIVGGSYILYIFKEGHYYGLNLPYLEEESVNVGEDSESYNNSLSFSSLSIGQIFSGNETDNTLLYRGYVPKLSMFSRKKSYGIELHGTVFICLGFKFSKNHESPQISSLQTCDQLMPINDLADYDQFDFNFYYEDKNGRFFFRWKANTLMIRSYYTIKEPKKKGILAYKDYEFNRTYTVVKAFINNDYKKIILYEFDNEFNLYMSLVKLKVEPTFEFALNTLQMNITEFFGCYKEMKELEDLRGIVYLNEKFYLLFYGFYLVYSEDLVETKFKLSFENPEIKHLNFDKLPSDSLNALDYELSEYKWSMTANLDVYLRFDSTNQDIFIATDNEGSLELEKSRHFLLDPCLGQLLEVKKTLFCLERNLNNESVYYKTEFVEKNEKEDEDDLRKKMPIYPRYPINDIFQNISDHLEDIDLKKGFLFIFTYKYNQVVFLTDKHMMRFDYDLFSIGENDSLIIENESKNKFSIDDIYLIGTPVKKRSKGSSSGKLGYIMMTLVVLILLMIVAAFLFPSKLAPVKKYIMANKSFNNFLQKAKNLSKLRHRLIIRKERNPPRSPKSSAYSSQIAGSEPGSQSKKYSFLALKTELGKSKKPDTKPSSHIKTKLGSTSTFPFFVSKSKVRINKAKHAGF